MWSSPRTAPEPTSPTYQVVRQFPIAPLGSEWRPFPLQVLRIKLQTVKPLDGCLQLACQPWGVPQLGVAVTRPLLLQVHPFRLCGEDLRREEGGLWLCFLTVHASSKLGMKKSSLLLSQLTRQALSLALALHLTKRLIQSRSSYNCLK